VKTLDNDLLIRALLRQPVPRTPVWIMRQAGRYLPEYRELREKAGDFMNLCRSPELACEVTLQPLRRYRLDAAILFSDILTVPDAMGLGLYFETGEGPRFRRPVSTKSDIRKLRKPDVAVELAYVFDTVRAIRKALDGSVPLIGFAGSPWTVATYMVEGRSSRDLRTIKGLATDEPKALEDLLDIVCRTTIDYLNRQIDAGAQAIMVFDTWGAALAGDDYRRFSLANMQQIVAGLKREAGGQRIPVILFTKAAGPLLADMAGAGCDALGVDWTTDLATARRYVNDRVALQGNLDPATLRKSPGDIREGVAEVLASYGTGPGHVFNLGHGITPDIDPGHVAVLVDAVHELSPQYHRQEPAPPRATT
jgi:uroporphyrinogen decarboxylase